ncbi:hypothetical protein [Alsobacter metallidurans]|uniref:hypothetical protein n=1 Tax=Alsobacter metallidurans TaxID=340221 RepID=UPI001668D3A3|nr:hypothetical protein [Alsobacter metallidurans]
MLAVTLLCGSEASEAQMSACRLGAAVGVADLKINPDGDLASPDGRTWIAAGAIAVAGGDVDVERRRVDAVKRFTEVGPFVIYPVAGRPDRWGRLSGVIGRADQGDDLALALVREGLASANPAELPARCGAALAAAEALARRGAKGAWAQAQAFFNAAEPAAILQQVGRFAVVEGRVVSTSERKARAYLNFGENWSEDFTVTISKRSLNRIEASGMRWSSLKGLRVRVRGVVAESGGPVIEINAPEDIERIE